MIYLLAIPRPLGALISVLCLHKVMSSPVLPLQTESENAIDKLAEVLTDVLVKQVGEAAEVIAEAEKRQSEMNGTAAAVKRQLTEEESALNVTEVLTMKRGQVLEFVSRQIQDVLANETITIEAKKRQGLESQLASNIQFLNETVAEAKRQIIANMTEEEASLKRRQVFTLSKRQLPVNVSVEARDDLQMFSQWLDIEQRQLNETMANLRATALIASSMAQIEDVTSTDFGFKSGSLQETMSKYLEQFQGNPAQAIEVAKGLLGSLSGFKDSLEELYLEEFFEDE